MKQDLRLLLSLSLPTALVAVGILVLHDVRWAFLLYVFGGCLLGPWILLRASPLHTGRGLPWREPPTARSRRVSFGAFLVFGPLFLAIYALVQPHLGRADLYLARLRDLGWHDAHQGFYALAFVMLIPLAEEWWWRGQALPRCVTRFGRRRGILLTASGFAAYHWLTLSSLYDPLPAALRWTAIALVGLLWTWLASHRRSWQVPYFAHLAADLAVVAAFFLFVRPEAAALG